MQRRAQQMRSRCTESELGALATLPLVHATALARGQSMERTTHAAERRRQRRGGGVGSEAASCGDELRRDGAPNEAGQRRVRVTGCVACTGSGAVGCALLWHGMYEAAAREQTKAAAGFVQLSKVTLASTLQAELGSRSLQRERHTLYAFTAVTIRKHYQRFRPLGVTAVPLSRAAEILRGGLRRRTRPLPRRHSTALDTAWLSDPAPVDAATRRQHDITVPPRSAPGAVSASCYQRSSNGAVKRSVWRRDDEDRPSSRLRP